MTKEPATNDANDESSRTKFLTAFKALYRQHRGGVTYLEHRSDPAQIDHLLGIYGFDHLVEMATALMLVTATDDSWIASSDRAIAVLKHRATYLDERTRASVAERPEGGDPAATPALWDCVLARLQQKLPRYQFEQFLRPTRQISQDGDLLVVSVLFPEQGGWIERHYGEHVKEVLTAAGVNRLEFVEGSGCQ